MNKNLKLFMVLLGCTPKGRTTEQHDVFFGIGEKLSELKPQMNTFWPEAKGKLHIDAWREVTKVDDYSIEINSKTEIENKQQQLFFLNLGGYKPSEFEEYHYKMLTVSARLATAVKQSKKTVFYKHCGFKGAESHIDEKYGIDVDDAHKVEDLLSDHLKANYQIKITPSEDKMEEDKMHIGYLNFKKLPK